MATLTLRNVVGRPLTYTETDDNFTNLDSATNAVASDLGNLTYSTLTGAPTNVSYFSNDANYLDSAAAISVIGGTVDGTVDSAYINARVDIPENVSAFTNDAGYIDSIKAASVATTTIDQAYIQANQDYAYSSLTGAPTNVTDFTNNAGYIDSLQAVGAIYEHVDSNYVQDRQSYEYGELVNTPTALSQFSNDLGFTSYDSSDTIGIVNDAYVQAKTSLATLTDTNISALSADQFLKWNGTTWINHTLNLDGAVQFHGVVNVATDNAPSSPFNGDLYINNTNAVANNTWTGLAGITVDEGEAIVYSGDDSQWFSIGGVSNGGVIEVSGGAGITVTDSPDHQYISVAIDQTQLDLWIDSAVNSGSAGGTVNLTGDQTINGVKKFNDTLIAGVVPSPDLTVALHTDGDLLVERTDGNPASLTLHTNTNSGYQKFQSKNDKLVLNMSTSTLAATDRFAFTAAGRLGINKISPQYELDVTGDIHATGDISADGKIDGGIF
jgi:hypothetical protein